MCMVVCSFIFRRQRRQVVVVDIIKAYDHIYIAFRVDVCVVPIGALQEDLVILAVVSSTRGFQGALDGVIGAAVYVGKCFLAQASRLPKFILFWIFVAEFNIRLSSICSGSFEFKTELYVIQCLSVIKTLILLNLKQITSSSEAMYR